MKKLLTLALALFVATSFATTPNSYQPRAEIHLKEDAPEEATGEIIFYNSIQQELGRFIGDECRFVTMDSDYGCLPESIVREQMALALFDFDTHYISEARDCDDEALEMIVKLRKAFRKITNNVPLAAPVGLVGVKLVSDIPEMGYNLHGGIGYHAIVVCRCAGGKWLLLDPQTKKVSEFTQHLYSGDIELRLVIF